MGNIEGKFITNIKKNREGILKNVKTITNSSELGITLIFIVPVKKGTN